MAHTNAELIDKYIELRARKAEIAAQASKLSDAMAVIENEMLRRLNAEGQQSMKAASGATAFKTTTMRASVGDRDKFITYVLDYHATDLLTNAVSKEAVKEYMEANNGTPPPGVETAFIVGVNFRKG